MLAGALALLAAAGDAPARTVKKLAGTTANASLGTVSPVRFAADYAQAFTTGGSASGYMLTRLEIRMEASGLTTPSYTVKIHSDSSTCTPNTITSCPGSEVGTLTNPSSPPGTAGLVKYNAPTGGIHLAPNTTYWLVRDTTANPSNDWLWYEDASDDEDDNPAAGWSIANDSIWSAYNSTVWASDTTTLIFAIYGYPLASKLVGNTGQTRAGSASFTVDLAQAFTTGSHSSGYRLTRVDFNGTSTATTPPAYSVSIHSNSSGSPGDKVGTLTNPTSLPASEQNITYSAPEGGIALKASTTYFVVIDVSSGSVSTQVNATASDAEDSDSESGWSIANNSLFRFNYTTGAWTNNSESTKIAVYGYAAPPMVSNTGQTFTNDAPFTHDRAQQFTTGSGTGGYKLNAVALRLKSSTTTTPVYSVSIQGDSSALPDGTSLGTLTTSATLTASYALVEFAAASAITLAASTDYWVVIDVSTGDANTDLNALLGANKDVSALPGWSIRGGHRSRLNGATAWDSTAEHHTLGIAVYGTSVDSAAPAFQSATVDGTALSVTFNENLYSGSAPAGTAFALSGGQSGTGTATISGATVSVTLGASVPPGASVTLGYTPPASGKKLQDPAGNFGAKFAGRLVTNQQAPPPQQPQDPSQPPEPPPPPATRPGAPERLTAVGGDGQVELNWSAPDDGGATITDYEYRIDGEGDWISTGSSATTYTVSGLANGSAYFFEVRAVNRVGAGSASDRVKAAVGAVLNFAHFANGDGITSDLVFVNPSPQPARPEVYFHDTAGEPVAAESVVDVTDDLTVAEDGGLTVHTVIEPRGELTIATHGRGELVSGSVRVVTGVPIGGVARYSAPGVGVAAVGAGPPVREVLLPARRREGGINTGAAIHNREEEPLGVSCRLMSGGATLEEAEIPLEANGQASWFLEDVFTAADTSDFLGAVHCSVPGIKRFHAIAVETDAAQRIFTALPTAAADRSGGGDGETVLVFPHFANGTWSTDLVFVNLSIEAAGRARLTPFHPDILPSRPEIYFHDTEGALVPPASLVDLTDDLEVTEDGALTVRAEMEQLGVLTISTHGRGDLVTGSVRVVSEGPIGGMLRFDHPSLGAAGMGAAPAVSDAMVPVRRREGGINTRVALHNLESSSSLLRCELLQAGVPLGSTMISLEANSQTSWTIDQAFPATDTSDFAGSVRCAATAGGSFSAAALETDPGNRTFTTLPVVEVE